jgi:TRAP-type C4-dicarboxylate transport system substrate-binding protein
MFDAFTRTAFALSILLGSTALAAAQKKVQLRFADSLPPTHLFTTEVARPWMEVVTEATGGAVTFQHYPAEQLGKAKDMLSLVGSGVADIAFVTPIYITDKLPLSGVYDLPGGPFTSCQGAKAFLSLATGDGILAKEEFRPNGIRVLMAVVQPPFQVFTASKEIKTIKDLSGLKLRSAGGAQDITATKLGIVPVKITAPETSQAMSRGTIDGGILAHVSIGAYGLTNLIKYATDGENFGSAVVTWSISEAKLQQLSPELQRIMIDAGRKVTLKGCKAIEDGVTTAIAAWREKGVTIVKFPLADHNALAGIFGKIRQEWAAGLDVRGRPGTQVLEAFTAAVEAAQ